MVCPITCKVIFVLARYQTASSVVYQIIGHVRLGLPQIVNLDLAPEQHHLALQMFQM